MANLFGGIGGMGGMGQGNMGGGGFGGAMLALLPLFLQMMQQRNKQGTPEEREEQRFQQPMVPFSLPMYQQHPITGQVVPYGSAIGAGTTNPGTIWGTNTNQWLR